MNTLTQVLLVVVVGSLLLVGVVTFTGVGDTGTGALLSQLLPSLVGGVVILMFVVFVYQQVLG